ncbi:MAG: hypothetical protein B7Y56_04340 [Gallionellales bacterium 35-53-114]|jgi:hypothetical protein|nr:MAG: hypothetical protein B7Y56_04340 [Gallionellales bacterium 35-53-114]OYZ65322.1 MAG: hypothetical protein B7Y04_01495 [Gallionellales bacterium 24-53-125]OZB08229.1 MAG: hypothetical protein B7X61_11950 [Gallionellales bacterium 39-52-133]HQS58159.1 hypothetical protein [Gallionellaceae bacterium]HQS73714.1 hypothetical protein [Gallionellaceae bacterium]
MKLINIGLSATAGIVLLGVHSLTNAASIDEKVSVHGYGDTGVIRAVENNYTGRFSGTKWDYNYLSLNITGQIDEKTKVVAQLRSGSEVTSDMGAYVNYNATDNLTVRAGQMKAPVGIFNEIRDIKFLQLSALSPLMYQDAAGTLPESFKGGEVIYHLDMRKHRLTFDIYGGEPKGAYTYVMIQPNNWFMVQNIYGGRLTYKTPIGLKFSLSGFQNDLLTATGATQPLTTVVQGQGTRRLSSASVDYRSTSLDIKLEYAIASQFVGTPLEQNGTSYYAQAGYTFAEKFTPYARYDYVLYNNDLPEDPRYYQKGRVLGLTYKLNHSVSMRMEKHWNTGYAIPSYAQGSNFSTANAKVDWDIFAVGVNFIF